MATIMAMIHSNLIKKIYQKMCLWYFIVIYLLIIVIIIITNIVLVIVTNLKTNIFITRLIWKGFVASCTSLFTKRRTEVVSSAPTEGWWPYYYWSSSSSSSASSSSSPENCNKGARKNYRQNIWQTCFQQQEK